MIGAKLFENEVIFTVKVSGGEESFELVLRDTPAKGVQHPFHFFAVQFPVSVLVEELEPLAHL